MMSAGFKWGANIAPDKSAHHSNEKSSVPRYNPKFRPFGKSPEANSRKRRYSDEDMDDIKRETQPKKTIAYPSGAKRLKIPQVVGHSLPMNRLVEVLDHKSLQSVLTSLIDAHPEIASTVSKLSPKPPLNNSIELLKEKFNDIIINMPYKTDVESDYSYLRVKPQFVEFLSCLSDFILSYLPPVSHNTVNTLAFLDSATDLLHELPNFKSSEFQYTRKIAYEQLANTWFTVMSGRIYCGDPSITPSTNGLRTVEGDINDDAECAAENSFNLTTIAKSLDLLSTLEKHERYSDGKFTHVIDFLKAEQHSMEVLNSSQSSTLGNVLGDLITVDYSNFSISH